MAADRQDKTPELLCDMSENPLPFSRHIPFVELLGLELWSIGQGQSELRLQPKPEHLNSWDVVHGGVVMTLLDVAMAQAGRSALEAQRGAPAAGVAADVANNAPGMVTIEMKTSFLRPAKGALRAVGKVLHCTASMAFVEAQLLGADGQLCAHATGTFKHLSGSAKRPDIERPSTQP